MTLPGADSLWLVAFGTSITHGHGLGASVPYAVAPTHAWANVPALAELIFAAANDLAGVHGLVILQSLAALMGFTILARAMRRGGGSDAATGLVLVLLVLGSVPALVVVRAQLFSLVLFPVLIALLYAETRRPSRRVWHLLPLVALWSSLHGAVLAGVAVVGAWLIFERRRKRPLEAICVLALLPVALCVTPALLRTPRYYLDVLRSEAVRRGFGLWAPLHLGVVDVLIVAGALILAALAWRTRPALWEIVAAAGLAFLTVRSARGSEWLLMFLAVRAASGLPGWKPQLRVRVSAVSVGVAAVLALVGLSTASARSDSSSRVVRRAIAVSHLSPVLADPFLGERVAAGGGRVWIANPIDAFAVPAQRAWLDWLQGLPAGDVLQDRVGRYVLVRAHSSLDRRLTRSALYRRLSADKHTVLYARRGHDSVR